MEEITDCEKCRIVSEDPGSYRACLDRALLKSYLGRHPDWMSVWIVLILIIPEILIAMLRTLAEWIWIGLVGYYVFAFIEDGELHIHNVRPDFDSDRTIFQIGSHLLRRNRIYGKGGDKWRLLVRGFKTNVIVIVDRHGNTIRMLEDDEDQTLFNQLTIVEKFNGVIDLWRPQTRMLQEIDKLRSANRSLRKHREELATTLTETVSRMIESGLESRSPPMRRWRQELERVLRGFGGRLNRAWKDKVWQQRRERMRKKRETN